MSERTTLCRCEHRKMAHRDDGGACMWGHHPDRHKEGWEGYREEWPECPCKAFEEDDDERD